MNEEMNTMAVKRDWPLRSAISAFLILLAMVMGAMAYSTVQAGAAGADGSRFVRIGLDKSLVVRLPAAASDVLIGNPEVVDAVVRTRNTAYLFARKVGQTNAFFFDANGRQILSLDIEVAHDTKALSKLLQRSLPGSGITVDTVGDNVVLGGTAKNASEAKTAMDLAARFAGGDEKKVVSMIAITGKEQVMLRVRIAELQRDVLKQFGIDTDVAFQVGQNFAARIINPNPFAPALGSAPAAIGNFASGGDSVSVLVEALERDGLLRTLAEPTLTAISGEAAKFLAGGEFPVPVGSDDDGVTIEFKPFGVGLSFTPVVLGAGRISMRISTEISELTNENSIALGNAATTSVAVIPGLRVRRAETTLEIPSGGSMVLAGLIKEEVKQELEGVPGVKNLPVLGALFRSREFQSSRTEMVVMVTPYVVNAVNENKLATPLDRLNVATDRQTILFGRLNKVYGVSGNRPKGTYHGNVGFIVE